MLTQCATADRRLLALKGVQNFREVGGYAAADGRVMRRGQIWRSARLDGLDAEDEAVLERLELRLVADLRRANERLERPTAPFIADRVRTLSWDVLPAEIEKPSDWARLLAADDPAVMFGMIVEAYRGIAEDHVIQYRELFEAVADGEHPVLIHCAAGKDRTGVAVAILLELLGVERGQVVEDYALTEQVMDWSKVGLEATAGVASASAPWYAQLSPDAQRMVKRSDPAYMESALLALEDRYGSVEGYCRERLGLAASTIAALRERLTEPVVG